MRPTTNYQAQHEQRVRAACDRLGLRMFKQGAVWIISGKNGTDIRATDLSVVRDIDLDHSIMKRTQWARQQ